MKYFILSVIFITLSIACKKNKCDVITTPNTPATCDVRGTYYGTATASAGNSTNQAYTLKDNNFAVGSLTVGGAGITFGGYRNTCDSIIISSYYTGNGDYYLLKGTLNSTKTVFSGTYQDLTSGIHGTFTFTKQ